MPAVINVAIALIGVYIVFALIASQIVEGIATRLNARGKNLFQGIERLVYDVSAAPDGVKPNLGAAIAAEIALHPLVRNLGPSNTRLPSYLPDRHFTLALLDAIRTLTPSVPPPPNAVAATPDQLLADLQNRVTSLPNGSVKVSLTNLLQEARGDYHEVLRRVDGWYNAEMDRASGWYARWASMVTIAIAAVLVIAFDVDTFNIVKQLADASIAANAANAGAGLSANSSAQQAVSTLLSSGLRFSWYGSFNAWTIPGLIVSCFAISLGAPFWFDLLGQFVSVRNAGNKPAPTTQPVTAAAAVSGTTDNAPLLLDVLSKFLAAGSGTKGTPSANEAEGTRSTAPSPQGGERVANP